MAKRKNKLNLKKATKKVAKIGKKAVGLTSIGLAAKGVKKITNSKKGKSFINKAKSKTKSFGKNIKKVSNKAGNKIKKTAKSLGHQITHPLETLKNVANNAKGAAQFAALLPFVAAMKLALKRKHISVPKRAGVKGIASLFYMNFIAKKSHLELEHCCNSMEHAEKNQDEIAFDLAKEVAANSGVPGGSFVVTLIHSIVDYFKGNSKKAKAEKEGKEAELTEGEKQALGESYDKPLDEVDKEIADNSDKVEKNLNKKIEKINSEKDNQNENNTEEEKSPENEKEELKDKSEESDSELKESVDGKIKINQKKDNSKAKEEIKVSDFPLKKYGFLAIYNN